MRPSSPKHSESSRNNNVADASISPISRRAGGVEATSTGTTSKGFKKIADVSDEENSVQGQNI